ncbi:MAG: hypothetical protein ACOYOP_07910 [Microthrixaceae bacterium]
MPDPTRPSAPGSSAPRHRPALLGAAVGAVGVAGLLAGGCSSSDDAATTTTTAPPSTTASTTSAPTTTAAGGAAGAPAAAPAGSQQLQAATANGASYWRYSITGSTPQNVVSGYQSELQSAGYTVTSTGGGGGGWGKWGGAGAGLTGQNGGSYVSVQAGGQSGGPTWFEVCVGPSSQSVQDCENASDGPNQNQDQNNSNSGAS